MPVLDEEKKIKEMAEKAKSYVSMKDEAPVEEKDDLLTTAILGLGPVLLGAVAGGAEGGAIGGKVGSETIKGIQQEKEKAKERALQEQKTQKELAMLEENLRHNRATEKLSEREMALKEKKTAAELMPPTTEKKIASLNANEKGRLDNILMAREAVKGMDAALGEGQNTFTLIGDNDYTMNRRNFAEALGRMQSGGAITADEQKKFEGMLPRSTDSADIQAKKMQNVAKEMDRRLQTLGFKPEEMGGAVAVSESYKKQPEFVTDVFGTKNANADQRPKVIIQGGHTYTLNPETGEYE